jgi:hypothetical protein
MAVIETIEGSDGPLWFHYDVPNDVLYVRLGAQRDAAACGEETDDGLIMLRSADDDRVIGVTVVNWWKRFGQGSLPDSVRSLVSQIEPWTARVRAAA